MSFETAALAADAGRGGPSLAHGLFAVAAIGALTVLSLPPARGASEWLGWLPLWFVILPLAAWLAALCLRAPRRRKPEASPALRRRRPSPAPRRRHGHGPGAVRRRLPRAA